MDPGRDDSPYLVPPGTRRGRADRILAAAFPEHSRTAWQRAFAAGLVRRGGRVLGQSDPVEAGQTLEFSLPPARPAELRPAGIPLDVLFEDRHLLAVNKPAGMVVHPGAGTREDTLVHALLAHCRGALSGVGGIERPGIVHRLDRGTSGVILVAKTDGAHRGLAAQFSSRRIRKEYLALVAGAPALGSGSIRSPIGRSPRQRQRMAAAPAGRKGREARTDWILAERFGELAALIRCLPQTGRTHQIRVHLKSIGHPLLGDGAYGWKHDPRLPARPGRTMLHAERIGFVHPVTGRPLDLRAPLPADFREMAEALRKATRARRPA